MTRFFEPSIFVAAALIGVLIAHAAPCPASEPVRLIFDTDICGDCDDVLALGMIHALESRGQCRLLAVTITVTNPLAGPFVSAVNSFYGRGDIPIGVVGPRGVSEQSAFLALVEEKDRAGKPRFPHHYDASASHDAVDLLRKTLAAQPDGSVVIAQVGFSTNLAALLASKPDAHSPLTGKELAAKKVRLVSLMAGAFQAIDGNARYGEYNIVRDIPAAQALARDWPTPLVFSGFEIGIALPYPAVSIERDYVYAANHPLEAAYRRRNPPPHNRPTWDLTSVLHAVQPDRGYFDLSQPGAVTVAADGATHFEPAAGGKHRYLILKPAERPRVLEALVQLSSQPPDSRPR